MESVHIEEELLYEQKRDFNKLNFNDFNLNNGLNSDLLENFNRYFNNKDEKFDNMTKELILIRKKLKSMLEKTGLKTINTGEKCQIYSGLVTSSELDATCLDNIRLFLYQIDKDAKATWWVPKLFLSKLFEVQVNALQLAGLPNYILRYLGWLLDWYHLTLMINEYSEQGYSTLYKLVSGTEYQFTPLRSFSFLSRYTGQKYTLLDSFVYIHGFNVLLDRDFLLCLKDIAIGRFQTLACNLLRVDRHQEYNSQLSLLQESIYLEGDKLKKTYGSKAFDIIKMVEPYCVEKMAYYSAAWRTKFPKFHSFEKHLKREIDNLGKSYPGSQAFFEKMNCIDGLGAAMAVFSTYRHWGHPYIDYRVGLTELFQRLNKNTDDEIDNDLINDLASDFARDVLFYAFERDKKWPLDITKLQRSPMRSPCLDNRLPTPIEIDKMGDKWHLLPITTIWIPPEVIPLQNLYSDKSHSVGRSEFLECIANKTSPSRKVLITMQETPSINYREFLQKVNDKGLEEDSYIIGLRDKEREVKQKGRYFALMSWEMREYFVATEYLLKEYVMPLFKGVTMAEDQNSLSKKLLDLTKHQGTNDYEYITIANHLDYAKWCNSQRMKATDPFFKVLGQCFGMPMLFCQTHRIFQKSWIYYTRTLNKLRVVDGVPESIDPSLNIFQNGILGGLEGLRQKGWCFFSMLNIRRAARMRATFIKILAQGDNQVILCFYKVRPYSNDLQLKKNLESIVRNNNSIMKEVYSSITRLGMSINKDETVQSADFMIYGKIPVIRGAIYSLEHKRWSRITGLSNDQLPTLANLMGSVGSNALTVSQFSLSPVNPICYYHLMAVFTFHLAKIYNYILKRPIVFQDTSSGSHELIGLLYLDPSLGGIAGVSLTRFLMRGFPDKVTEGLSFWLYVARGLEGLDKRLTKYEDLCYRMCNPSLAEADLQAFKLLLEDPSGLNIQGSLSASTYLQEQVKKALIDNVHNVQNRTVQTAVRMHVLDDDSFVIFLNTIKPCFPRFFSDFFQSTFLGNMNQVIGLIKNSRTLMKIFRNNFSAEIDKIIHKSEIGNLRRLMDLKTRSVHKFTCSRVRADELRFNSYQQKIIGATQPHPIELLGDPILQSKSCAGCSNESIKKNLISVTYPEGFNFVAYQKGRCGCYMGSKTSNYTSLVHDWETKHCIHLVEKAFRLKSLIGWICDQNSNLAKSILNNLNSLTGLEFKLSDLGITRSGSWEHRYMNDRVSSGGFVNQNVLLLTYVLVSSDRFNDFPWEDSNFMFQTLMIYSQLVCTTRYHNVPKGSTYHLHLNCEDCVAPIETGFLESNEVRVFPDMSVELAKMKPDGVPWYTTRLKALNKDNTAQWVNLTPEIQSRFIGIAQGFIFSCLLLDHDEHSQDNSIFPLTLRGKLSAREWLQGITIGLVIGGAAHLIHHTPSRIVSGLLKTLHGMCNGLIRSLIEHQGMVNLCKTESVYHSLTTVPHKIPSSYPLNDKDAVSILHSYMLIEMKKQLSLEGIHCKPPSHLWFFADFDDNKYVVLASIGLKIINMIKGKNLTNVKNDFAIMSKLLSSVREGKETEEEVRKHLVVIKKCKSEIRSAARNDVKPHLSLPTIEVPEVKIPNYKVVDLIVEATSDSSTRTKLLRGPRFKNPGMSAMRSFQLPTGGFTKILGILIYLKLFYRYFLGLGDGSGGGCLAMAYYLRSAFGLFNSLYDIKNASSSGVEPSPPSALLSFGPGIYDRILNFRDSWEHPSDLSEHRTWDYFLFMKHKFLMKIDLIIMDMEFTHKDTQRKIKDNLIHYLPQLLEPGGTLIVKDYLVSIFGEDQHDFSDLWSHFKVTQVVWSDISGSGTSEIYWVFTSLGHPGPGYLDYTTLYNELIARDHPYFLTMKEEFQRLQRMKLTLKDYVIPGQFIPDLYSEMSQLFLSLGIRGDFVHLMADLLKSNKVEHYPEALLSVFIVGYNDIFNSLKLTQKRPIYPSDGDVEKLGILYISFYYYLAIISRSESLYRYILFLLNTSWGIYYREDSVSTKSGLKTRMVWSTKKSLGLMKAFPLTHRLSVITHIIRLSLRNYNPIRARVLNFRIVESLALSINRKLTLTKINEITGWFDVFQGLELPNWTIKLSFDETYDPATTREMHFTS